MSENNMLLNTVSDKIDLPKILLIEDDAVNANVIQKFLRSKYNVDIAYNGTQGLELAGSNDYCLVLMDINLGRGQSGIDVLNELRKIERYTKIPVIASTAYTMKGDKEKLLEAGFDDYISKPYSMNEILIKITENLH